MDDVMEPTRWRRGEWEARVVPSEDGEGGWAVEMYLAGEDEPALVGPWTMGRDKKNPKPLDAAAFATLVKTASEVLQRHEQQAHARMHRMFTYQRPDGTRVRATLDLGGDDDEPYATLTCADEANGEVLASERVNVNFRMTATQLERFLSGE